MEDKIKKDANIDKCPSCGCVLDDNYEIVNGEKQCNSCIDEYFTTCQDCGEITDNEEGTYINDNFVCNNCINENYYTCEDCGHIVGTNHINYVDNDNRIVCDSCFYDDYYTCTDCGGSFSDITYIEGDDVYLCEACLEDKLKELGLDEPIKCEECGANLFKGNKHLGKDYCNYCYKHLKKIDPLLYQLK